MSLENCVPCGGVQHSEEFHDYDCCQLCAAMGHWTASCPLNTKPPQHVRFRTPERDELDRVATLLINEWERVEGKKVNPSYVPTFVDLARVVIADRK